MGLCLTKHIFIGLTLLKFRGVMNFICFLSSGAVVSGEVVLAEWFIDFLRLCAVKYVHQGKAGAEFCGGVC